MKRYYALFESNTSSEVGALFMGDDFLRDNLDGIARESNRQALLGVWREILRAYYALSNKLCSFPKEVKDSPAGVSFEFAGRKLRLHRASVLGLNIFALSENAKEDRWRLLLRVSSSPRSLRQVYVHSEADAVFIIRNWSCMLSAVDQAKGGERPGGLLSLVTPEDDGGWMVDIEYSNDGSPDKEEDGE